MAKKTIQMPTPQMTKVMQNAGLSIPKQTSNSGSKKGKK